MIKFWLDAAKVDGLFVDLHVKRPLRKTLKLLFLHKQVLSYEDLNKKCYRFKNLILSKILAFDSHKILLFLEGYFEIEDYNTTSYMYECIAPLRALLKQKTAPKKYKKVRNSL